MENFSIKGKIPMIFTSIRRGHLKKRQNGANLLRLATLAIILKIQIEESMRLRF